MREPGFYWVKIGDEVEVARYEPYSCLRTTGTLGKWHTCGSEDYYYDDSYVQVLSDRLQAPK